MRESFLSRRESWIVVVLGTAAVTAAVPCDAGLVGFTDRDDWLDAAGAIDVIRFTELPDGTRLNDQYQELGIHFTDVDDHVLYSESFPNDGAGARGGHINDDLRISFDQPIHWLATDFLEGIEYDLFRDGMLIATSQRFDRIESTFGGIVSDEAFDAAILRDPGGGTNVDDLYFQRVPAPGALVVWAVGLASGLRRRRARTR